MYFLIFLLLSLILAIPTLGISLIIFFLGKMYFDKIAINSILSKANESIKDGYRHELVHINRGAVHKLFDAIGALNEVKNLHRGTSIYWGVLKHPIINGGLPFSLRIIYFPRIGTSNTIFIDAASGVSEEILNENVD